ncbi:unnamed protein product, partial [Cladocopium goreaui]
MGFPPWPSTASTNSLHSRAQAAERSAEDIEAPVANGFRVLPENRSIEVEEQNVAPFSVPQEVLSFQPDDQAVFARFMNGDCERKLHCNIELLADELEAEKPRIYGSGQRLIAPAPGPGGQDLRIRLAGYRTHTACSDPGPEGERAEPWSSQWRAELVGACTPEQLLDLDLSPLESWVPRLSACGEWSPLARLGRGLRAGVAARIRLSGESTAVCESPRLAVQNRTYVVLRAAPPHASGWTTSYNIYVSKVRGSAGERFHRDSVSHAFASRAEASAYVLGAGCSWPPEYQGDTVLFKSVAYLVKCRSGGFMFLVPDVPEVTDFVTAQEDVFGCRTCTVTVELPRGKRTSEENAVLVDATWDHVSSFTRWSPLRGDEVETVHRFYVGQSAGRPSAEAVMAAADAWIHDAMDDDTAGDYVTGDSGLEGFAEPPDSAAPPHGGTVEQDAVLQMQQRILELETRLGTLQGSAALHATPKAGGLQLLSSPSQPADAQVLQRLRALAGSGPGRLGAHERTARAERPEVAFDNALQEEMLGATEEDELHEALATTLEEVQDPMQRLLVLQTQQLSMLSKHLTAKNLDPIQKALGGSDASGSSSSGVRGCLARDAFLKMSQDLPRLASVGEQQILTDLGLQAPVGARSGNRELQGFAMKGMTFVDQASIDAGRTQLAWLLTGLPEPNYQVCQRNKQRAQLQPFSKLTSATAVAANVSYLKDLDFLEGDTKAKKERQGKRKGVSQPSRRRGHYSSELKSEAVHPELLSHDDLCGMHSGSTKLLSDFEVPATIQCIEIMRVVLQLVGQSHSGLGEFLRRSLFRRKSSAPRHVCGSCTSADLWPCPPPLWRWTGPAKLSPGRRKRRKFLETRAKLLQVVIIVLNWLSLGYPKYPSTVCELGAKISDQQHAMIERLESLVGYFLLAEPVAAAELGRAGEKLSKICDAVIQLPSTVPDISWDEMASFLDMIHRDFDPYSSTAAAPDQQTHHDASGEPVPDQNRQLGVDVPLSVSPAKPVIAERIKWKLGPTFNPEPFLVDPVVQAAFKDPDVLRKPATDWPAKRRARVHCDRAELKKLAEKWDKLGACALIPVHCDVFMMDASPFGGALCRTRVGAFAAEEMWRHTEQRGYYTALQHGAREVLHEKGLDHEETFGPPSEQTVDFAVSLSPAPLWPGVEDVTFDCIELFSGSGNWSKAHAAEGFRVHPGIERGATGVSFGDLMDPVTFRKTAALAASGKVKEWHAGPPCWSFGTLRRPRLRSKMFPAGFNPSDPVTYEQTILAMRTAFILTLALLS